MVFTVFQPCSLQSLCQPEIKFCFFKSFYPFQYFNSFPESNIIADVFCSCLWLRVILAALTIISLSELASLNRHDNIPHMCVKPMLP